MVNVYTDPKNIKDSSRSIIVGNNSYFDVKVGELPYIVVADLSR